MFAVVFWLGLSAALSPAQRSLRARIAAFERWSREDGKEGTRAATEAGVTKLAYWLSKVDPGNDLPDAERIRRAESARRAHYARMQLRSAQVRAARKAAG